jgi:hypothetical protein
MIFRYYCPKRPPKPGAVPYGAIRVGFADSGILYDEKGHRHKAWGLVEYDHRLTPQEVSYYELDES